MANIWWKRSTEVELEKAYQRAGSSEGRVPYFGRPLVFQAKIGYFWGVYVPFFLVIETCRNERGCAGLHYVAKHQNFYCRSNVSHAITRRDIVSGLTKVLISLNIDRNIFFESLNGVKKELKTWESEVEKKQKDESDGEKTLRTLEEMLNSSGFT